MGDWIAMVAFFAAPVASSARSEEARKPAMHKSMPAHTPLIFRFFIWSPMKNQFEFYDLLLWGWAKFNGEISLPLDRLAVDQSGLVAPLADGFEGLGDESGGTAQRADIRDGSVFSDGRTNTNDFGRIVFGGGR